MEVNTKEIQSLFSKLEAFFPESWLLDLANEISTLYLDLRKDINDNKNIFSYSDYCERLSYHYYNLAVVLYYNYNFNKVDLYSVEINAKHCLTYVELANKPNLNQLQGNAHEMLIKVKQLKRMLYAVECTGNAIDYINRSLALGELSDLLIGIINHCETDTKHLFFNIINNIKLIRSIYQLEDAVTRKEANTFVISQYCSLLGEAYYYVPLNSLCIAFEKVYRTLIKTTLTLGKETSNDSKEIINKYVISEIEKYSSSLEEIEIIIEESMQISLSNIDKTYIQLKFIEKYLQVSLKDIELYLDNIGKIKDFKTLEEIFVSLDTFNCLQNIPYPVDLLPSCKQLIKYYKFIEKDETKLFIRKFKEICIDHVLSYCGSASKEIKFLENILIFLESCHNLQLVIATLEIESFCFGNLLFNNFLDNILDLDCDIYGKEVVPLQTCAVILKDETHLFLLDKIKSAIENFIKPLEINLKYLDGRHVLEIEGTNIVMSEVLFKIEDLLLNVEELRFIASGKIIIDDDLKKESYHGKNIIIATQKIEVSKVTSWDVSGFSKANVYNINAGMNSEGHGKDGDDGFAGESGGNVYILAREIVNEEHWTINSNGGDGSNGQDGGIGRNGENGKGMTQTEFEDKFPPVAPYDQKKRQIAIQKSIDSILNIIKKEGSEIKEQWLVQNEISNRISGNILEYIKSKYGDLKSCLSMSFYLHIFTNDGKEIIFSNTHFQDNFFTCTYPQGYVLVKGSRGTVGGRRGEKGLGGEGGHSGEIDIQHIDNVDYVFNVNKILRKGNDGKDGKNGSHGNYGDNGWDIAYLDFTFSNFFTDKWPKYFGKNENSKLSLAYESKRKSTNVYCQYTSSYIEGSDTYVYITSAGIEHNKKSTYSDNRRNRTNRDRKHQAKASMKKTISQTSVSDLYIDQILSDKKSVLQGIYSDIENIKINALQALAKTKEDEEIEITTEQRFTKISSYIAEDKSHQIQFTDCSTNFNVPDVTFSIQNCTKDNFLWMIKNCIVLTIHDFKLLYGFFNQIMNEIDEPLMSEIRHVLLNKFHLLVLHQVNLQNLHFHVDYKPINTARNVENYLLQCESDVISLNHSSLGNINNYIYIRNATNRNKVLNVFKEATVLPSSLPYMVELMQTFFIELEEHKNIPSFAQHVFCQYQKFILLTVEIIDDISNTYTNNETTYNDIYEALSNYSFCDNVLTVNNQLSEKWFKKFVEKHERFDYTSMCQNDNFVNKFVQFVSGEDAYVQTYLVLLAHIFETNLRIYNEDDCGKFSFLVEFNRFADDSLHLLLKERKISLLKMNQEYYKLQCERLGRSKIYLKILCFIDELEKCDFSKTANLEPLIANHNISLIPKIKSFDDEEYIIQISKFFNKLEKQKIKSQLMSIKSSIIGNNFILYFLSKRFTNEGCHVPFQVLSFLINVVLDSFLKNQDVLTLIAWIIATCTQSQWIYKFFILYLESYFKMPLNQNSRVLSYIFKIYNPNILLLIYFNLIKDSLINFEYIVEVLRLISLADTDITSIQDFRITEWNFVLKENYFIQKLLRKFADQIEENDVFSLSYYIISVENIFGEDLVNYLIDTLLSKPKISVNDLKFIVQKFYNEECLLSRQIITKLSTCSLKSWLNILVDQSKKERHVKELASIIKNDSNNSPNIIKNITKIENILDLPVYKKVYRYFSSTPVSQYNELDIISWAKNYKDGLNHSIDKIEFILNKQQEVLNVIDRAIFLKNKFYLRDTQKVSILSLITNNFNTLAQVSTGEGKSLIVVAVAIMKAMNGEKVDIITSSSVLAKRDSIINSDIYSLFEVSVSNNCSEKVDERKTAYSNNQVIYGDLSNFQRDYLIHEFYGRNVLGDRDFMNVIVDEVDSMLLDKGNNILYLSHSIANLDKLESVFTFNWQWVNKPTQTVDELQETFDIGKLKDAIMLDLFCKLKPSDLQKINSNLKDSECSIIYNTLVKYKILDPSGKVLVSEVTDPILIEELSSKIILSERINTERLNFFLSEFNELEKFINVPNFLKPFVEDHIEAWGESALTALFMQERVHYILDVDRSGTSDDRNPNITIIDRDTGTDQANSQWDETLHQCLQLKHGCKVSLVSLKAVFISNVSYFKMYKKLYGLTGTLGSEIERNLLKNVHQVDFVTIPTAKSKCFNEERPILCNNTIDWLKEIEQATLNIIKLRSVLIICESVKEVECLGKVLTKVIQNGQVHTYTRDYEELDIAQGDETLDIGHVIIATNLAGRGTDIKITDNLKQAGGLHVILSYLPENKRIEQQAFGRAARCGDKGSGQLIVLTAGSSACRSSEIISLKRKRDMGEIKKISCIKSHYENQILIEENCFKKFKDTFKNIKNKMTASKIEDVIQNIISQIILDKWAFWLDKNSKKIKLLNDLETKINFENSLEMFLLEINNLDFQSPENLIKDTDNPVFTINLAKHYCEKKYFNFAESLLSKLITQEPSEIAHYYKAYAYSKRINWENAPKSSIYYRPFKYELRKASKGFKLLQDRCMQSSGIIETMKQKNKDGILQIEAYEAQQKAISNMYNIFIQSVDDVFGHIVQHNNFANAVVSEQLSEKIYNDLIEKGILKETHVSQKDCTPSLQKLTHEYGLSGDDLFLVIKDFKGKFMKCNVFLKKLTNKIMIASREGFWKILVQQKIITEGTEVKYILINENLLNEIDPSFLKSLKNNFNLTTEMLQNKTNAVFLYPEHIKNVNENSLIYKKADFKKILTEKKYNYLKEKGVFMFNKESLIDINVLKNSNNLSLFDVIKTKDFSKENICESEVKKIISALIDLKILKFDEKLCDSYCLIGTHDNIEELELKDFPLYESSVKTLLRHHFAYRLALNKIKSQIDESSTKFLDIPLLAKPHNSLFWSLVEENVIKPVKFDVHKSKDIENKLKQMYPSMLSTSNLSEIMFSDDIIPNSYALNFILKELVKKKWLRYFDNHGIRMYKINDITAFQSLSDKFKQIEDTLKMILKNRLLLSEDATIQGVVSTAKRSLGTLKSLDVPDFSLKLLTEYFNDGNFSNIVELQLFTLNGVNHVIQLQEKKYTTIMIWSTIAVVAIGLCQIVIGVVIELYSVGFMTHVGSAFISEGISDLLYAASASRTGYFSWKDYGKHKLQSLMVTAASAGIAGILSRGAKVSRFGHKIAGPTTEIGGKKVSEMAGQQLINTVRQNTFKEVQRSVGKEVAKRIALKSIEGIAVGLANAGVDYVMENHLQGLCDEMATSFISGINKKVDEHDISKTLASAYFSLGEKDAENFINHFTTTFMSKENQFEKFVQMSSKIASTVISGIAGASQKLKMSGSAGFGASVNIVSKVLVWSERASHILKIIEATETLLDDMNHQLKKALQEKSKSNTSKDSINHNDENYQKFRRRVIDKWKIGLEGKVGSIIQHNIASPILKDGANHLVRVIGRGIKSTYRAYKEKQYFEQFKTLKQQHNNRIRNLKSSDKETKITLEKEHNKKMMILLAKTRSPELFGAIIRENVAMNITCVEACTKLVSKLTGKNIKIKVNSEQGLSEEIVCCGDVNNPDVTEIVLELKDNHFQLSGTESEGTGSTDNYNNCLFESLSEQLNLDMNAVEFRNKIAGFIETDKEIRYKICQGWHQFSISYNAFGGAKIQKKSIKFSNLETCKLNKEYERQLIDKVEHKSWKFIEGTDIDLRNLEIRNAKNENLDSEFNAGRNLQLAEAFRVAFASNDEHLSTILNKDLNIPVDHYVATQGDVIKMRNWSGDAIDGRFPTEMKATVYLIKNVSEKYTKLSLDKPQGQVEFDKVVLTVDLDIPPEITEGPHGPHVGYDVKGPEGFPKCVGHILLNSEGSETLPDRGKSSDWNDDKINKLPSFPLTRLLSGPLNPTTTLERSGSFRKHVKGTTDIIRGKSYPSSSFF